MHGIKVPIAKNYSDNLSEETRKRVLENARSGMWPNNAPVGYGNLIASDGKRVIARSVESFRGYPTLRMVCDGRVQIEDGSPPRPE